MGRLKTELTTERANLIKDHLHLSNKELEEKTGLSEKIIDEVRTADESPNLKPRSYKGSRKKRKVREADDKFTVKETEEIVPVSRAVIYKDIKQLDFLEKKKIGKILYLTSEELEKYKSYYD